MAPGYVCYSRGMASIEIRGETHIVTLSAPDSDGCYTWACACGAGNGGPMFIADAINDAEVHIHVSEEI